MPDDLLGTVKTRLQAGACVEDSELRALVARCEQAEARVRQLSEHHAFEVVDPVGGPVAAPCAIDGCQYAALRERHAEAVEAAWAEAVLSTAQSVDAVALGLKAWDHSKAKARLTNG